MHALSKAFRGRLVDLLGVIPSYREAFNQRIDETNTPVRFWWDQNREGSLGPIRSVWDACAPSYYILDSEGVIRYKKSMMSNFKRKP